MIRPLLAGALLSFSCSVAMAHGNPSALQEWRFRTERDLTSWTPNSDIRDLRVTEAGVAFNTSGADPILELHRPFEIEAAVHQAIEVRLSADRDGEFEVFWSGSSEGRYGGFSPEKRTAFRVRGDGVWRTYRIFPFWHREERIRRLRLDPFAGASFRLGMVRILGWKPPATLQDRFNLKDQPWLALHETDWASMAKGARIELLAPGGFALSPLMRARAMERPILHLRAASRQARRASILFATSAAYGLQEFGFDLVADGKPHAYNLDMLAAPAWNGEILAIGIRPGEKPGDEIILQEAMLADRPQGPAEIRVLSLEAEETLPRAGRPFTMSLRMSNAGGEAGTVSISEKRLSLRLEPGEETEFRWVARFGKPGAYRIGTTLRFGRRSQAVSTLVKVSVAPPKALANPLHVRPVQGPIRVGAYYFPGWRSAGQWSPITRFPERRPALGWYREGSVEAANWHLKWAAEHGISFFVYDWYWIRGARQLEHGIEAYLKSPNRKYVQFCLLWANHNPPGTSSLADCLAVTDHWIARYFRLPEHLRIDGKPAVVIFAPGRLREDIGSEKISVVLEEMRERCYRAGLGGLYVLACVGGTGEAELCAREGYDAVTAYNWPTLGMQGETRRTPFAGLIEGYQKQWKHIAERCPIPLLPPVCGGWDSRPWHGGSALVRNGRNPADFRKHLASARDFIARHPGKTLPLVLVEAWNEWGEGSYIEPHREFGFGYLDAIREVFAGAGSHTDVVPADANMPVPQIEFPDSSASSWSFEKSELGWESGMNITPPRVIEGALQFATGASDSALFSPPLFLDARQFRRVRIRFSLDSGDRDPAIDSAQIFWSSQTAAESEAASVRLPATIDGQERTIEANLASNPRWRGRITRLRLDPCNRMGIRVRIRSLVLLP